MIVGFNAGGFSWVEKELQLDGVTDRDQMLELIEDTGYSDARSASDVGGPYLRVFTNAQELVNSPDFTFLGFHRAGNPPMSSFSLEQKLERLDRLDASLDVLFGNFSSDGVGKLDYASMDAYLRGVIRLNQSRNAVEQVRILLTFVEVPPRWILDAPSSTTCRQAGRNYSFQSLWHKWIQLYIRIARSVVEHVAVLSRESGQNLLCAVEIVNEPDYEWLPDEYRIERALAPQVNPLHKYVTELHLNQIPHRETSRCIQGTPWGGMEMQDGEWPCEQVPETPLEAFPWGPKLEWYIRIFADLHTHLSWAVRDELGRHRCDARVVSCSVTHNNLLYFAQMFRANPETFAYVDAIGVHPYHFPGHDIYDNRFRNTDRYPDWRTTTPREYARDCFKRFDFIEELSKLTMSSDPAQSCGLAGKKIWITEFGIPTKRLGKFNQQNPAYAKLIRGRLDSGSPQYSSAVWEDLWDSFFEQVSPDYLRNLGVEAFFFYALRETTVPGFDKHDDDRSNFALLSRDGRPRMASETAKSMSRFLAACAGRTEAFPVDSVQRLAGRLGCLLSEPDPARIHGVTTMLSDAEKRLLYFLSRNYYSQQGAIVDAGCFLGGSTVALASGLLDRGRPCATKIDSFDLFEADSFMVNFYLTGGGYHPGDSFLPLYERNIEAVRQVVTVHAGDLRKESWNKGPIEILFIDIAKSWDTNDHLVSEFFRHLIPGRSLVVQQDYVHEWCPWLHITMEKFADYFEPLGFVEHNTMVFRLRKAIPAHLLAIPVSGYSREEKLRLMHQSVNRFSGIERGFVECAEAVLLCELGEVEEARKRMAILASRFRQHPALSRTIEQVTGMAQRWAVPSACKQS